ncbi:breast cancer anti-estrogen resistance protein 3 homolog isoform X2 [Condylostylus longicornis]|nr:breast cancer anti-estrogen resistance protein 3 homolog isoform X2 [Condylostylus longicornis]
MDSTTTTPTLEIGHEALVLKKALEWELSLDSRDLRSHAWYHGAIPRQRSEEIVQKDGDFLVRDCASQPGNYVLTCKSKSVTLHFVIHKILIQPETVYERVQYQFEEDAYDTVPDLITFYVGSGKPISAASGARIQYPCNRSHPLSFYGNKFIGNQLHNQILTGIRGISPVNSPSIANLRFNPYNQQGSYNNTVSTHRSPMSSPPRTKRDTPPRLPSKKQRSQSLTPLQSIHSQNGDKYCSVDGISLDKQQQGQLNTEIKKIASQNERSSSADGIIQTNGTVVSNIQKSTNEKSSSADGVIRHCNGQRAHSHSLPRPMTSSRLKMNSSRTSSLNRETSNSSLTPCAEQNKHKDEKAPSPPPKPTRPIGTSINNINNSQITPTQREKRESIKELPLEQQNPLNRVASYHASGSDSGNGSGDSAQSSAPGDLLVEGHVPHRGVIIKNPRFMTNSLSSMTLKSFNEFDIIAAEQELASMDIPIYQQLSKFDLENFNTLLLPAVENNPLDSDALNTFRIMLSETGPRIIAQHLTRIDVLLILGEFDDLKSFTSGDDICTSEFTSSEKDNILFNCSGIELITLPHGETFRNDLIERTQCIKLLVAITIMTCQNDLERAEILDKWIQIAIETKTALGNLFGFCAIMLGLCMPQIQKLEQTWHILRQKFTDSAFTFEAKLRPTLKSMNDCSNPQAPNTTVPHLLPYILLRDRTVDDILMATTTNSKTASNTQTMKSPQQKSSLVIPCVTNWESNADDFGISILFSHLDAARNFTKNISLYRRNAQIVLESAKSRLDDLLSDAFRTEFHIKFLWGSKGALVSSEERHSKLEHVIGIMADKFCKTEIIGNAG